MAIPAAWGQFSSGINRPAMKALSIDVGYVVVAKTAIDSLEVFLMREVIHSVKIGMTPDTVQIRMDRTCEPVRVDVE
jgi:hypothetical protein